MFFGILANPNPKQGVLVEYQNMEFKQDIYCFIPKAILNANYNQIQNHWPTLYEKWALL